MSYADVNGLSLWYEEHGTVEPTADNPALVLLHGGLGGGDMFAPILPELAENRRVITVDLQAHSHTAEIDRPLRFETSADDVAALIRHLGLGAVDILGYSVGGGVALRTAVQHPDVVRRQVVVSFPVRQDGWLKDVRSQMGQMSPEGAAFMKETPMFELYSRTAPRVEDFPVLVGKVAELITADYDYSAEVAALTVPTLLAFGDADSVGLAHVAEFWSLLGGGEQDAGWDGAGRPGAHRLAVLPGCTHYDIFMAPALVAAVDDFLA